MAVAVVGDMDIKEMQKKIEQHFSAIENPENAPERVEYEIPGNTDPLIAIVTDKEATNSIVQMFVKHPKAVESTVNDYRNILVRQIYNRMITKRFNELTQKPDAPFIAAGADYSDFIGPVDTYSSYAVVKENRMEESIRTILVENERVKKFGFTQGELDREKQVLLIRYDQMAREAGKNNSNSLADEYIRNFLKKEPVPGIITENAYARHFVPGITLTDVNMPAHKWMTENNMGIIVTAPEKAGAGIPSEDEIKQLLKNINRADITEYVDQTVDEPLLPDEPEGSRVVRRKDNTGFGYSELTFMNGVQVVLKPTDFKNDQILFSAFSPGGTSLYVDEDYMSAMMAAGIVTMSGLGNFDQIALGKKLTGSTARLSPYISELYEGVTGTAAPKDLETLLQLNHLYFTAVRRDENAFNTLIAQLKNQVANMKSNPVYAYMDTLYRVIAGNDPRTITIPTEEQINQIKLDHALYIFNDRFADAGDFKYVMVGNFDVNEIIPLLEKYLGGLPSGKRVETWRDVTPSFPPGIVNLDYARNSEEQSRVNISMKGDFKWTLKERIHFAMMTDILNIRLRESMREEQGGVYGVSVSDNAGLYPESRYSIDFAWGCSPGNADVLIGTVFDEVKKLKAHGPAATDLAKVKETFIRERETEMKENTYWLQILQNVYRQGDRLMTLDEYKKLVNSVKVRDIRRVSRKYINENNYVAGKLMPLKQQTK
jgi:zinc protease